MKNVIVIAQFSSVDQTKWKNFLRDAKYLVRTHRLFWILSIVLGLGINGCATPTPRFLGPEILSGVKSTEVISYIPQNELAVEYLVSQAGGQEGGLLGAMADAKMNKTRREWAQDRAKEINAQINYQVKGFDFRPQFWAAISPVIQETSWLGAGQLQTFSTPVENATAITVPGKARLVLGTGYYFSGNSRVIGVDTGLNIRLMGNNETPAAVNLLRYKSAEIGLEEDDAAIKLWLTDGGITFRKTVAEATTESAKMLRYALGLMGGNPPKPLRSATIKVNLTGGDPPKSSLRISLRNAWKGKSSYAGWVKLKGWVIEETAERIIFQDSSGTFLSLPAKGVRFVEVDKVTE